MLPMYSVAVVEGEAVGMGAILAATMDRVIASSKATFNFAGLTNENGGEFLLDKLGHAKFKELVSTSAVVSSAEGKSLQIVHDIIDGEAEYQAFFDSICDKISKTAPNAVAEHKAYVQMLGGTSVDVHVLNGITEHIAQRSADPEFQDSLRAVMDPTHEPWYAKSKVGKVEAPAPMAIRDQDLAKPPVVAGKAKAKAKKA